MKAIFETYNLTELRKLATNYNKDVKITNVSKLKKPELIEELLKHTEHFKDLKPKPVKAKPVKAKPVKAKPVKAKTPPPEKEKGVVIKKRVKKDKPVSPPEKVAKTKSPRRQVVVKQKLPEDAFINEFDTPHSNYILYQYDEQIFENIEKLLSRMEKKKDRIDLDVFLSRGVHIPLGLVRKLYDKYGLKKLVEHTKDLLLQINSDILEPIISEEAINNPMKSKILKRIGKYKL